MKSHVSVSDIDTCRILGVFQFEVSVLRRLSQRLRTVPKQKHKIEKATNLLLKSVKLVTSIMKDINDLTLSLVFIYIIKCLGSIFLTKCTHIWYSAYFCSMKKGKQNELCMPDLQFKLYLTEKYSYKYQRFSCDGLMK